MTALKHYTVTLSLGSYFRAVQVSSHDETSRAMIRSIDAVMLSWNF
jgi:hypothetical protein